VDDAIQVDKDHDLTSLQKAVASHAHGQGRKEQKSRRRKRAHGLKST